jgi:hypothetical protein
MIFDKIFNFYWMIGKANPTIKIGGSKVYFATAQFLLDNCKQLSNKNW